MQRRENETHRQAASRLLLAHDFRWTVDNKIINCGISEALLLMEAKHKLREERNGNNFFMSRDSYFL
jgi:hypothetical protein